MYTQYTVCGDNQEWDDCGSACPAMCNERRWWICTDQCVPGCFCKDGYKLNDWFECVPEAECPTDGPTTTDGTIITIYTHILCFVFLHRVFTKNKKVTLKFRSSIDILFSC